MSEKQGDYNMENEVKEALEMLGEGYTPVVQFEKPSEQIAEYQGEYKLVKSLGWIKFSAEFRNSMLAKLKGAKLSIFISICLHLNENGESFPGIDKIAKETGYNRDTIMNAIAEMEEIPNLLKVLRKQGKVNRYRPAFAARGAGNEPVGFSDQSDFPEEPVQKNTTGLSQTSLENLDSKKIKSIKKNTQKSYPKFSDKNTEERRQMLMLSERVEAELGITPDFKDKNWEYTIRKIVQHEQAGQMFERWVQWLKNGNDYNRPKIFQLAAKPRLILNNWMQAFTDMSGEPAYADLDSIEGILK